MSWVYRAWRLDLNLTNRPVRTRMPGVVGGEAELLPGSPIPICVPGAIDLSALGVLVHGIQNTPLNRN